MNHVPSTFNEALSGDRPPLPDPFVPGDADVRSLPSMLLDVVRLRDCDLMMEDGETVKVSLLSWAVSWHQIPAGSLPDDDRQLARLLGYGKDVNSWKADRARGVLYGWTKCSDGRLYHRVVAEKVKEAMETKREFREKTEAARRAKAEKARLRASGTPVRQPIDNTRAADSVTEHVTEVVTDNVTESVTALKVRKGKVREDKVREVSKNLQADSDSVPAREDVHAPEPPPPAFPDPPRSDDPPPPPPPAFPPPDEPPRSFALNRTVIRLSDPPSAWEKYADRIDLIEDPDYPMGPRREACFYNQPLHEIAQDIGRAAQIRDPNWIIDAVLLIDWLSEGYDIDKQIIPTIAAVTTRMAARANFTGVRSLRLFDPDIRGQRPLKRNVEAWRDWRDNDPAKQAADKARAEGRDPEQALREFYAEEETRKQAASLARLAESTANANMA